MTARSYLFVPGIRPDRLEGSLSRGADAVIADLEDGVAVSDKDAARRYVADWLKAVPEDMDVWVRINNHPEWADLDLAALQGTRAGVIVPKTEDTDLIDRIDVPTIAQIESARGWRVAGVIAEHPNVVRLACGEFDLAAELGLDLSPGEPELTPFRMEIVRASAAARIDAPVASPSTDFRDLTALANSTRSLMRMGFRARMVIHPAQIDSVNRVFTPTKDQVDHAERLISSFEEAKGGVFVDENGRMVDEAVIKAARSVLNLAHRVGVRDE